VFVRGNSCGRRHFCCCWLLIFCYNNSSIAGDPAAVVCDVPGNSAVDNIPSVAASLLLLLVHDVPDMPAVAGVLSFLTSVVELEPES
jgi:hypothetical protein